MTVRRVRPLPNYTLAGPALGSEQAAPNTHAGVLEAVHRGPMKSAATTGDGDITAPFFFTP